MKRINIDSQLFNFQLQLDNGVLEDSAELRTRNAENMSLRDFMTLLKSNLVRDELIFLQKELTQELDARMSMISEAIPNDVWTSVFRLLSFRKDISTVFPLMQVCKRWKGCFIDSLTKATICRAKSMKGLLSLTCIRSLSIQTSVISKLVLDQIFPKLEKLVLLGGEINCSGEDSNFTEKRPRQMTYLKTPLLSSRTNDDYLYPFIVNDANLILLKNLQILKIGKGPLILFDTLKQLIHLKKLDISYDRFLPHFRSQNKYGNNLEILEYLKELKIIKLDRCSHHYFRFDEIQKKYSHIEFRWYMNNKSCYYKGEFSNENLYDGIGAFVKKNGERYEGEWKNGKKEGRGNYYFANGERYEGEWKNDKKEGRGNYYFANGERYEGEWKNDKREGEGIINKSLNPHDRRVPSDHLSFQRIDNKCHYH